MVLKVTYLVGWCVQTVGMLLCGFESNVPCRVGVQTVGMLLCGFESNVPCRVVCTNCRYVTMWF